MLTMSAAPIGALVDFKDVCAKVEGPIFTGLEPCVHDILMNFSIHALTLDA